MNSMIDRFLYPNCVSVWMHKITTNPVLNGWWRDWDEPPAQHRATKVELAGIFLHCEIQPVAQTSQCLWASCILQLPAEWLESSNLHFWLKNVNNINIINLYLNIQTSLILQRHQTSIHENNTSRFRINEKLHCTHSIKAWTTNYVEFV